MSIGQYLRCGLDVVPEFVTRRIESVGPYNGFYMVSVVNGPQDLLLRRTEEAALVDGAAYVREKYCYSLLYGWTHR